MVYLEYRTKLLHGDLLNDAIIIGTKEEIRGTIIHYRTRNPPQLIKEPYDSEFMPINHLVILCYNQNFLEDMSISVKFNSCEKFEPRPDGDIEFKVSSDGFMTFRNSLVEESRRTKRRQRGPLYKYIFNDNQTHLLPLDLVNQLRSYNWNLHNDQVKNWLCGKVELDPDMHRTISTNRVDVDRLIAEIERREGKK